MELMCLLGAYFIIPGGVNVQSVLQMHTQWIGFSKTRTIDEASFVFFAW